MHSKRTLYQLDSMAVWLSPGFGFGFAIVCTVRRREGRELGTQAAHQRQPAHYGAEERGKEEGGGYFTTATEGTRQHLTGSQIIHQ